MVISYTGESENEGCGGTEGGNDCLWWCCKVGLCAFLYLITSLFVYLCLDICVIFVYMWRDMIFFIDC